MKLVSGNGRTFEVRDVGAVIVRLRARADGPPIKFNRTEVVEDDAARAIVRELIGLDRYDREV